MKSNVATYVTAAVLLFGAAPLMAAPEDTDALLGSDVFNQAGDKIGTLKEFVIDPNSKELQFAAVESGGVLGMGAKTVLVPWQLFQLEPKADNDKTRVILDATIDKLQGSVEYDSEKPVPADQVNAYWGINAQGKGKTTPMSTEGASEEPDEPTDQAD